MNTKDYNILIVDDNKNNLYSLRMLIEEKINAKVIEADSGEKALSLLLEEAVDLILLDIQMPKLDGFDTARLIKSRKKTKNIPIIFLTASFKSEEFVRKGFGLGAIDYITKPINSNQLMNRMDIYLKFIKKEKSRAKELEQLVLQRTQEIRDLNETLKALIENNPDLIIRVDKDLKIKYLNEAAYKNLKIDLYSNEIFLKKILKEETYSKLDEKIKFVFESKKEAQSEILLNNEYYDVRFSPELNLEKQVNFVLLIGRNISEYKEYESMLINSKIEAEKSNNAKRMFLANMSHELRTPMNGIIGMASLLKCSVLNQDQKECLESIDTASENLMTIINNILDISNIESGTEELIEFDFNLYDMADKFKLFFQDMLRIKKLKFIINLDKNIPKKLIGDKTKLWRVLINLLSNAEKFTHKGFIKLNIKLIHTENNESEILFEVEDSGIGIDSKTQERIFNIFEQGDSSYTKKYQGVGLGLAISNKLVDLLGGKLKLKSEIDIGSTFYFTIKFKTTNSLSKKSLLLSPSKYHEDLKVLIVEDDHISKVILGKFIENIGGTFKTSSNGLDALKILEAEPFDLIIMDIHMPKMNGYDTIKTIREKKIKTPIIVATAYASNDKMEDIKKLDINGFIVKPYTGPVVYNEINKILNFPK